MKGVSPTARLIRAVVVLGVALTAMLLVDRALARREAETRPVTAVLRELVPTRVTAADIVELHLVDAAGRRVEFRRDEAGLWRCMSAHGLLAEPARMNRLLSRLLGGGGMVRSDDPAHAGRYGIGGPATMRIVLFRQSPAAAPPEQSPPDDAPPPEPTELEIVLDLELGLSIGDADQSFVRVADQGEIIALEADIRRELRPDGPGGLPLIEPHLLPTSWPGIDVIPRQIILLRRGALPTELRRVDNVDESGEVVGWRWMVRSGEEEFADAHSVLPMMYVAFLARTRLVGVLGADALPASGIDAPIGRVLIGTDAFEPLELRIAPPRTFGTAVYVSFARTVAVIPNEVAELMLPGPEKFHPDMPENPWAAYTEQRSTLPAGLAPEAIDQ